MINCLKTRGILIVFVLMSGALFSQAKKESVRGIVQDEKGQSLIGVTITVENKAKNFFAHTQSDTTGMFSFKELEPGGPYKFTFSYIGYEKQVLEGYEYNKNEVITLSVKLQVSSRNLNEMVVVGYGTQRKRDLTGAITQVKGDEVAKMPNTNPLSSLQGRVAGLTVVNGGTPGAAPTVRIRGVNSVNSASPLYVVDGVHQSNIDYLDPADIENIEILRDASSIAIFGLQAANGVIVVTTKRAVSGATRISVQSSAGVQKVLKTIDVVDSAGFKKLYNAQLANINASPFDYTNYNANTDWQDEILRSAFQSNNSVSVSNSNEKSTTLVSLGYNNMEGVMKFSKYQRYVGRINEDIKVGKNIKVGAGLTGTHWIAEGTGADLNNALWAAPIVGIREDENTYYSMPSFQRGQVGNPVARLYQNNGNTISKGYRAVGNVYVEVAFLKQFTFKSQVYTDLGFNTVRGYSGLPFTFINLGEGSAPTERFFNTNVKTSVNQRQEEFRKFQQDHTLSYNLTYNDVHKITAVAGFTSIFEGSTFVSGSRTDLSLNIPRDPSFWYIGIAEAINPSTVNGGGSEKSSMGFFGRLNYTYKDKYLLNATYRRDGISSLSPQNRWGNFGGVGIGWVISEEDFFKAFKGIDFLKLRGAWGAVGNAQGIDNNIFRPGLTTAGSGVFGENIYPALAPAYIADPNLRWEILSSVDLGLDVRALDNRLNAEINLYKKNTKDIITSVPLLSSSGNLNYRTNLGNIANKGLEVSLNWSDKIGGDFSYSVSPNFSYNKNEVVSIGNNFNFQINRNVNRTVTGESIGHFYGYRQTGIYQSTADLDKIPRLSNSLPGDIAYADLNGDGVITAADRENLGSPFPSWSYGLNVTLGYKGFDLLLQGQGVADNYIYTQRRTGTFADLNYETNRLNAWTAPGTSNVEPILEKGRGNNYLFSSYFLEPGDYFRLRTVQLGYTFKLNFLPNAGMKLLRVYASGQNIHTWSKTTGYSPEAPISDILAGGADNGVYPIPATFTFGISATF